MSEVPGDNRTPEQLHAGRLKLLELFNPDYKSQPTPEQIKRQEAEARLLEHIFGTIEDIEPHN